MKIDYIQMKKEQFDIKDYFKTMALTQSRLKFSLDMKMTRTIKSHYFGEKEFADSLWFCPGHCNRIDSIQHIAWSCEQYDHLKQGKDILNNDHDLVKFIQQVIKQRDEAQNQ